MNRRFLTLVTLLLWGLLLTKFWATGRIESYLHPQFHPLVAISGCLLLVLAFLWWWASGRVETSHHDCGCHHDHEPEQRSALSAGTILAFVLLLVPVSAATIVSPSQFGEAAVMNRGIVSDIARLPSFAPPANGLEDAPPLQEGDVIPDVAEWPADLEEGVEYFTRTPDGAIQLETLDLMFAAAEPSLREEFENQRVSVTGQYIPPRGKESGRFELVRMLMVCCAADSRPIGIGVVSAHLPQTERMGWIRVTGTARFTESGDVMEPHLEADKIEEVPAPSETVLY
jgi:uncharacterized repeat protein (TIGR03943 family)